MEQRTLAARLFELADLPVVYQYQMDELRKKVHLKNLQKLVDRVAALERRAN